MASVITATTTSGLTQSADNSGVLQLASGTGNLVTVPSVTGTAMVSGNMPAFSAYLNGTQSISSATATKIQFNTEEFDTANAFDSTTNYRFNPQVAGYYQINAFYAAYPASGSLSNLYIFLFKNGSQFKRNYTISTISEASISISHVVYMNGSSDYLEVYAQTTGTSPTVYGSSTSQTYFSGALVRAA